jgi:hypothetical protein
MQRQLLAILAVLVSTSIAFSETLSPAPQVPSPASSQLSPPTKIASPAVAANYGKLPLSFEANQGQADSRVKFISHGTGYSLFLTGTAAVLQLTKPDPSKRDDPGGKVIGKTPLELAKHRPWIPMKTDVVRMELAGAASNSQVIGDGQLPGKSNYFIGKDSGQVAHEHSHVRQGEVQRGLSRSRPGLLRQPAPAGVRLRRRSRRECEAGQAALRRSEQAEA